MHPKGRGWRSGVKPTAYASCMHKCAGREASPSGGTDAVMFLARITLATLAETLPCLLSVQIPIVEELNNEVSLSVFSRACMLRQATQSL